MKPLIITLFLGLLLSGCDSNSDQTTSANPATLGGAFTLQSTTGKVSLADFKGKVVVLYFGYTSCPDICPTSLAILTSAFHSLDKEQQQEIQPLLISLDPERDTAEKLKDYTAYFIPKMIGLTGSLDTVKRIAKQYKVNFRKTDTDSALGYVVDHASIYFIIGRDGKLFTHLMHNANPEEVAEKMKQALAN
ncbi:MAG: SCO family protein [Cocleimonas sp.]|nr:SCO family protein [Cocleimonas sp.]